MMPPVKKMRCVVVTAAVAACTGTTSAVDLEGRSSHAQFPRAAVAE